MNRVYLMLLLVGLRDIIYFLKAEFINLREFPNSRRGGDAPSYLIYKERKRIFCLTKYLTCYASYFPFHTIFKSFSLPFLPSQNINNNWGENEWESIPSWMGWARAHIWACCIRFWATLENLIFSLSLYIYIIYVVINYSWDYIKYNIYYGKYGLEVLSSPLTNCFYNTWN